MKKCVFIVLLGVLFLSGQMAFCETGGEITPVHNDNLVDNSVVIDNESGVVYYIVSGGGDISIVSGPGSGFEDEEPEEESVIKPQVTYGVVSDLWVSGIAICNPYDSVRSGLLKIGSMYFTVSVNANDSVIMSLSEQVGPGKYVISLISEDLVLWSDTWKNF